MINILNHSGGMLNDMWFLRFNNWSLPGNVYNQRVYMERSCKWRLRAAANQRHDDCVTSSNCDFYDLLMLAWCDLSFEGGVGYHHFDYTSSRRSEV